MAGLDPFALLRGFSRAYGLPPHAWVIQERVRHAQALLRTGLAPAEVAAEVGFSDQSHLTRHFKRILGFTPGSYRHASLAPAGIDSASDMHVALRAMQTSFSPIRLPAHAAVRGWWRPS